jgi:hypothetical protein
VSTQEPVDDLERRRREVEAAREDLARSVDALSGKAIDTRNQLREKLVERAVPIAVGVGVVLVAAAIRRRRRRPRVLVEAGPFVLFERR